MAVAVATGTGSKHLMTAKGSAVVTQLLRRDPVGATCGVGFTVPQKASVGHLFSVDVAEIQIAMVLGRNAATLAGILIKTMAGGSGGIPKAILIRGQVDRKMPRRGIQRQIS